MTVYTLFDGAVPAGAQFLDGDPGITVAVSAFSDEPGDLTHVLFYCGPNNGGTWVGYVWTPNSADNGSGTGDLEASATMVGTPTANAWNEIALDPPVPYDAGVLFRVGIHNGQYYWANNNYFAGHDEVNGPLTAPHSGDNPTGLGNLYQGSFAVSATPARYPDQQGSAANYAVDFRFDVGGSDDRTTAGTAGVSVGASATVSTARSTAGTASVGVTATAAEGSTRTTAGTARVGIAATAAVATRRTTAGTARIGASASAAETTRRVTSGTARVGVRAGEYRAQGSKGPRLITRSRTGALVASGRPSRIVTRTQVV
jgi:hypothetical protein